MKAEKKEAKKKQKNKENGKRRVRLKDTRDALKLLVKLINERYNGEISGRKSRDLGYLVKLYLEAFKECEFEERLKKLEEAAKAYESRK